MIKINLNKTRADVTQATRIDYQTTVDNSFALEDESAEGSGVVVKFLLMGIGLASLYGYEFYNIGELKNQVNLRTVELSNLEQQIQQKEPIAGEAEKLQKEILAIESRIEAIKSLAKERLREIKAIDYIQNVIPERVWVVRFEFDESSVRIEGGAMGDDDLKQFIENLEGRSYFKNVVLLQSLDQKTPTGAYKGFVMTSTLISRD